MYPPDVVMTWGSSPKDWLFMNISQMFHSALMSVHLLTLHASSTVTAWLNLHIPSSFYDLCNHHFLQVQANIIAVSACLIRRCAARYHPRLVTFITKDGRHFCVEPWSHVPCLCAVRVVARMILLKMNRICLHPFHLLFLRIPLAHHASQTPWSKPNTLRTRNLQQWELPLGEWQWPALHVNVLFMFFHLFPTMQHSLSISNYADGIFPIFSDPVCGPSHHWDSNLGDFAGYPWHSQYLSVTSVKSSDYVDCWNMLFGSNKYFFQKGIGKGKNHDQKDRFFMAKLRVLHQHVLCCGLEKSVVGLPGSTVQTMHHKDQEDKGATKTEGAGGTRTEGSDRKYQEQEIAGGNMFR